VLVPEFQKEALEHAMRHAELLSFYYDMAMQDKVILMQRRNKESDFDLLLIGRIMSGG